METTNFSRNLKIACLLLVSAALADIGNAQMTWTATTTQPSFWLDGSTGVTLDTGSNVGSWEDARLGNGGFNTTVSDTGIHEPTYTATLNSIPVVSFTASQYLFNSAITGSTIFGTSSSDVTVFVVQRNTGGNPNSTSVNWVDNGGASFQDQMVLSADYGGNVSLTYGNTGASGSTINASSPGDLYTSAHVISAQRSGTLGFLHEDGAPLSITSGGFTAGNNYDPTQSGALQVGGFNGGSTMNGNIAAVVIFNTSLSPSDTASVESYLGNRFGISVVPEPSQYAAAFSIACLLGALGFRLRRNRGVAVQK